MEWCELLHIDIPAGWHAANVGSCLQSIERGLSYSSEDIATPNIGAPMLNLACFDKNANYRTGELKSYSGRISSEKDYILPGDMLVACTDLTRNADIIGRPIFAPWEHEKYVFSMDLAKISVSSKISKEFLYHTLRTQAYHRYIKPFASGTNVLHLNIDGILNYPIIVPTHNILMDFTCFMQNIAERSGRLLNDLRHLQKTRDWLLPMLMNGQVSVDV